MLSPYAKAALFVIRLIACGLIILGGGLLAEDLYLHLSNHPISPPAMLVLKALPALLGVALYAKSKGMAIHVTKDLD
ncbi:MAG TPA: hypothetical protein VGO59_16200 [Verrucomicrobiae bacterium]|jgi:hypothetical protein